MGKRNLVRKCGHVTLAETAVGLDRRSPPRNFQFPNLLEPLWANQAVTAGCDALQRAAEISDILVQHVCVYLSAFNS